MYGTGFYNYTIDQSLRFNDNDQPSLSKTYSTAQTNTKIITISVWVKRGDLGRRNSIMFAKSGSSGWLTFRTDDKLYWNPYNTGYNGFKSTRVFRDTSAWYHIVATADSENQSGANIYNVYVNGEQLTNSDGSTHVPDDTATKFLANGLTTYIGDDTDASTYHHDGYLAEMHVIDGSVVAHTEFGETKNGVWVPKEYSGSYGNNGFYLSFADSANIGDDLSGNTNDFTATNLAVSDVVPDSPTNNFPTLNPLHPNNTSDLTEGNLRVYEDQADYKDFYATFAVSSGKWYWEARAAGTAIQQIWGFAREDALTTSNGGAASSTTGYAYLRYGSVARERANGSNTNASGTLSVAAGDIIGLALNLDDNEVKFYKNGTLEHTITGVQDGIYYPFVCYQMNLNRLEQRVNFGQDSTFAGLETAGGNSDGNGVGDFAQSVISGHLAICSANLPEPAIGPNSSTQADDNFNTVLYTGDGSTSNAITGVGFQPDFTWIKNRTDVVDYVITDAVRGATIRLESNSADAEATQTEDLKSFDADGFTVGSQNRVNGSSDAMVAWNWKAGGTAVSNTDGSITSSVSANTDAGFSIVSWTGTGAAGTIGHGLSSAPEHIIVKNRDTAGRIWLNYVEAAISDAETDYLSLNGTGGLVDNADVWNDTAPTATVFSVGSNASANQSSNAMIAYCFHSVEGYSKAGSYKGNASTDGTFVYTGFRPAWLMIKNTADVTHWALWDTKRNTYNVSTTALYPSSDGADNTGTSLYVDFLSSGFKWRSNHNSVNGSNDTFIYLAFAEAPFKYANAR